MTPIYYSRHQEKIQKCTVWFWEEGVKVSNTAIWGGGGQIGLGVWNYDPYPGGFGRGGGIGIWPHANFCLAPPPPPKKNETCSKLDKIAIKLVKRYFFDFLPPPPTNIFLGWGQK